MKRYMILSVLVIAGCLSARCGDDEKPLTSVESVQVAGTGYEKVRLTEGTSLFSDDERYRVLLPPTYFEGFDLLISPRGTHNGGTIVPEHDGLIYLLAPDAPLPDGWFVLSGNSVTFTDPDAETEQVLNIFCRVAYAGRAVDIPVQEGAIPVFPLARSIEYVAGGTAGM